MAKSDTPRISRTGLKVLILFLGDTKRPLSGAEISREAGVGSGALYPILMRLEEAGWLSSEWEKIDPKTEGRPRRRYYRFTKAGLAGARKELEPFRHIGSKE